LFFFAVFYSYRCRTAPLNAGKAAAFDIVDIRLKQAKTVSAVFFKRRNSGIPKNWNKQHTERPHTMTIRRILILLAIVGALFLGVQSRATSVTLGWNPSPSSGVSGYFIYYGTSSGNYTLQVPVYGSTNLTINGLTSGQTYYFAATSFDSNYNQSAYTPEISLIAGSVAPTATGGVLSALAKLPAGQFGFALSGSTGAKYIVQASTDLVHWVALQTNVAPFNFVDSNAAQFPRRFYRTLYSSN
jgi:Fibronectin type III domain